MEVKIRDIREILIEITREAKKHKDNWYSIFGTDELYSSEDICIFNPDVGFYNIKSYFKNPFERVGIGAKIARKVDEKFLDITDKQAKSRFGIIKIEPKKILKYLTEQKKDKVCMGIEIPVEGPLHEGEKYLEIAREIYPDETKNLKLRFRKLLSQEETFKHYI
ncbi:MAG: hypothetical protein AB1779_05605 [Candidatus Thermoplasmatota archaeon]